MLLRLAPLFAAIAAALVLAGGASAGPRMFIGAVEDMAKQPDLVGAKAKMDLARLAGFSAVRVTATWSRGQTRPREADFIILRNAVDAASLSGIRVVLAVYNYGSRVTPRTARDRARFAAFATYLARNLPTVHDFIVGNEPNLNRFWMPQFGRRGRNAAVPAYVALLARTYDALKAVSPKINVIGGAISPRGGDNPRARRHTQSPTRFIQAMGQAYRKSRRRRPIMDAFALHPYPGASRHSPLLRHPRSTTVMIADYGKLVRLLGRAFNGTAQRGSRLPIVYAEFGVQSRIPSHKRSLYTNLRARSAADAVSEARQAAYYRLALALAYCQPTVAGFLIFHISDERDLRRWQSGLFYVDDTPKSSFVPVKRAVGAVRNRTISRCRRTR